MAQLGLEFMCVFSLSPPQGMTRKKHINNFLAPTQSRDNPANLLMFMCFFFPWFPRFSLRGCKNYGAQRILRRHFLLLCLLSRRILWIFFPCLTGNFALKNGGDFWWIFLVSVSHETKHEKSSKISGKIRRKIRDKIRDENSKNSGNFRSATFLT